MNSTPPKPPPPTARTQPGCCCTPIAGMLLALLLLVFVANVLLIHRLVTLPPICPPAATPRGLPCESIPIRFVHAEPRCANALLEAMNVTNVQIIALAPGPTNDTRAGWPEPPLLEINGAR